VSLSLRTTGLIFRCSLLSIALLTLLGSSLNATAQTAPQLLPYTTKLLAGGGATATFTVGQTCPVAGAPYTATDTYGDGCLATEISWASTSGPGPRYAIADKTGTVFIADYKNGLIRRVDPVTGIITVVAGGATSNPAKGSACGTNLSADILGDGCLSTAVKLGGPTGMVFDATGNLYFSDFSNYNVRKIAATAGVIPTGGGVITLVAGSNGGAVIAYGYTSNFGTTTINAATASYLDGPYGLAMDTSGDLIIAEEYKNAVLVVNTNTAGSTTVTGISIPAGTIAKISGSPTAGGSVCPNGSTGTYGCNYGTFTSGASANSSELNAPYAVGVDPAGNVYFANEYIQGVGKVNATTGILTNYAGIENSYGKVLLRAPAGTFAIGSDFGLTADAQPVTGTATGSNVYITDNLNGVIWRVDGTGQSMYAVGGGAVATTAGSPCGTVGPVSFVATDTYGDGCPGLAANFGHAGTSYSSTGIFGITVDAYADVYVGDTITNIVREVASGTQFGVVGANQPTDIVDIHFAAGDSLPATGYVLTAGATNFSLGKAICTTNSDNTTDCLLPVTATPTALGPFSGILTVTSTLGGVGNFPLNGNYVQSPTTRTALTASGGTSCTGSSVYATTATITLTATLTANGPSAPTGNIIFTANGTALAPTSGVAVTNTGTTSSPVYQAVLPYVFSTAGTYSITATYVPTNGSYFKGSTSTATSVTTSLPGYSILLGSAQESAVVPGGTALYSFNVALNVYTGTIAYACSGLPAYSSCSFSPVSITGTGCSTPTGFPDVVTLNVLTTAPVKPLPAAFGSGARGGWQAFGVVAGLGMALLIGIRRRRFGMRYGQLWMALALLIAASGAVACGNGAQATAGTPPFSGKFTVTFTGSGGTPTTLLVPLTVN